MMQERERYGFVLTIEEWAVKFDSDILESPRNATEYAAAQQDIATLFRIGTPPAPAADQFTTKQFQYLEKQLQEWRRMEAKCAFDLEALQAEIRCPTEEISEIELK